MAARRPAQSNTDTEIVSCPLFSVWPIFSKMVSIKISNSRLNLEPSQDVHCPVLQSGEAISAAEAELDQSEARPWCRSSFSSLTLHFKSQWQTNSPLSASQLLNTSTSQSVKMLKYRTKYNHVDSNWVSNIESDRFDHRRFWGENNRFPERFHVSWFLPPKLQQKIK